MTEFEQRLSQFAASRDPKGGTDAEITRVFGDLNKLPADYLAFLRLAGNGLNDFLTGSDVFLNQLDGVRAAADELLIAGGLDPLPSDAIVFLMHQGYEFLFLRNG